MRVVLDTNVVLSALLFPRGRLAWMRELWMSGRLLPLVCRGTARELIDALAYPKFKLDEGEIRTFLAAYLPYTEAVEVNDDAILDVPLSSDQDDQVFVRLAAAGRAEVLVPVPPELAGMATSGGGSGDRAILDLREAAPFAIETAAQFRKRFA